ncbi:hypothetical protein PSTG_13053 [Puccinia striiformis f. sp. tritici PST-78]|uniref:DUF659 domain-containing protein n=1 Tax=Puccinia striiformis f. sp. tritici PST-78 TaxID=1165861 RepID=A0A0L0V3R0_9BASI|nr:hypothetical protein PSTG_13053 [Puccinia striiformis f. sp. tritici PST-78]
MDIVLDLKNVDLDPLAGTRGTASAPPERCGCGIWCLPSEAGGYPAFGVTGTGDINPKEVPQLCAVWCAEAARPFAALVNASHQAILHPTVVKHLPKVHVVSKDIHLLYSAIQHDYRAVLNAHSSALYLGVDAWQSPNAFDVLGVYLADTVRLVVEKFGIQDKICGIVSDNANNNEVMITELKKLKWKRFPGDSQWICCFAHILNLIAQTILQTFGSQRKRTTTNMRSAKPNGSDSDESEAEYENDEDQIRVLSLGETAVDSEEEDQSDDEALAPADENASDILSEGDIDNASKEESDDCYTAASCKRTLEKFRAIAKKLKYSPNSKAEFIRLCRDKECALPHNIQRDVRTRWNSTSAQLNSIIRCKDAIPEWQHHKRYGIDHMHFVDQSDFDLAKDLAEVLNLFHEITLQVSVPGSARISNVVLFIDQITDHLSTVISDVKYPPALRNTCRGGLKITNKYYRSPFEPEWIAEAIRLAREIWVTHFKPRPITPTSSAPPSNKARTGMLAGLGSAAAARGGDSLTDAFDMWLAGALRSKGTTPSIHSSGGSSRKNQATLTAAWFIWRWMF